MDRDTNELSMEMIEADSLAEAYKKAEESCKITRLIIDSIREV